MATGTRKPKSQWAEGSVAGDAVRHLIVDTANDAIAQKITKQAAKIAEKAARRVESLGVGGPCEPCDVWTREQPGRRQPKLSRSSIARAAIAIADAEGFDAVSMRRIAHELGVGTMSLYHYVRTKDELLMVVIDEYLGEVIIPPTDRLPKHWRDAITVIARRSREALRRHPWILDISDDPNFGPNAIRHFDQSWESLQSMQAPLEFKLDVVMTVDEYIFGYCLHERNHFTEGDDPLGMVGYITQLLEQGTYRAIDEIAASVGIDNFWNTVHDHARDESRFDRNLARILDGIEAELRAKK